MDRPPAGWITSLPTGRVLVEMSVWSADLARIADEIARIDALTDLYHVDVADGHFSPALLLFPDLVACVRRLTAKPIHAHLMVADAILDDQIDQFAAAGADAISVHVEHAGVEEALDRIDALGLVSGVVLQLETPVPSAAPYLERIGLLTLLGTAIGVKGQNLAAEAEQRLRQARSLIAGLRNGRAPRLVADGGNREHTVPGLRRAGADSIVVGSLGFGAPDFAARIAWLHGLATSGVAELAGEARAGASTGRGG